MSNKRWIMARRNHRDGRMADNAGIAIHQERHMPTVNIQLYAGRTLEQKRAFAEKVTTLVCETLGSTPETVHVIFTDVKRENWATAGRLGSDPKV